MRQREVRQPCACAWACCGAIAVRLLIPSQPGHAPGIRICCVIAAEGARQPIRDQCTNMGRTRRVLDPADMDIAIGVDRDQQAPARGLPPALDRAQLPPEPRPEQDHDMGIEMGVERIHAAYYTPGAEVGDKFTGMRVGATSFGCHVEGKHHSDKS
mgnify:FL=1